MYLDCKACFGTENMQVVDIFLQRRQGCIFLQGQCQVDAFAILCVVSLFDITHLTVRVLSSS